MARKHRNTNNHPIIEDTSAFALIPSDTRIRWVNPYLSVEDKQWLQDNRDQSTELMAECIEGLQPGFNASIKYDLQSSRWLATIVCTNANHEACGQGISVRGASPWAAWYALAYIVSGFDQHKWWGANGSTSEDIFG